MSYTLYGMRQRKGKPFSALKPEYVAQLASEINQTVDAAGAALYQIAQVCEANGNRGLPLARFPAGTHWILADDQPAQELRRDILFFAEGHRTRDYDGWGVKKDPHWSLVWGERFGWQSEAAQTIIAQAEDEARATHAKILAEEEANRTQRVVDTLAGKRVTDLTTREVAYIAAVAEVLARRYQERGGFSPTFTEAEAILYWHYRELHENALTELKYRCDHTPPEQSSKKKTKAMQADWARAADLLKARTAHFFSRAFIDQAVASVTEPDLSVDWEHLPKLPEEQTPVAWKSDAAVIRDFMRFLDEGQGGSFEWEDARLILSQLRSTLARARGQKLEAKIKTDKTEE